MEVNKQEVTLIQNKVSQLLSKQSVYSSELKVKSEDLSKTKQTLASLDKSKVLLEKTLNSFNQLTVELTNSTVKHLESLVNQGLEEVFNTDETKYTLRIDLVSRTQNNQANFILIKEEGGTQLETKLVDNGFGIQSFIGLILRFYYILQNNLPRVLFIDEGLTAISVNHLDKVKAFLAQLCKKFNFAILLIAHDSDLFKLGDYFYTVTKDGTLEEGVFGE